MNSADRFELDLILDGQRRVHGIVADLDRRIDLLARHFAAPAPPPLPSHSERSAPQVSAVEEPGECTVRFPQREQHSAPPGSSTAALRAFAQDDTEDKPAVSVEPPPLPPRIDPAISASPEPPAEPLELRVGTYWMSRIGIVILLTGLVFLGNYAYHRFIALLGAGGKLALLTLAGGALAGLGAWLERKHESLRNYGRVLLAGGAATLYYTAYAAHFVERLRVIDSPLAGGTLLLALAGGILWFAERRRSEATALMTVLLSYYTSAINSIGAFTLFSNVLLTAVGVIFLVRNRWTRLPLACLAATYGSYAFWRFAGNATEFGMGPGFLASYWLLFTAAVFLAAPGVWKAVERSGFLTLNNGAFFAFAAHHFAVHRPGYFGTFALIYGATLLGLAALAARRHAEEPAMDGAYLAQGLAMVTVGFVAKFTGPQLAVVLAVESGALLACARWRHGWMYQLAAGLCAVSAFCLTLAEIYSGTSATLPLGGLVAGLLFANAWWVKWLRGEWEFTPGALGYSALGLLLTGCVLSLEIAAPRQPAAFALATLAALPALRIRLPEIAWPAQGFVLWGALLSVGTCLQNAPSPWWSPLPVVMVTLVLMHGWQHTRIELDAMVRAGLQIVFAATTVIVSAVWLHAVVKPDAWLVATSAAALATLLYGLATRSWPLALAGQIFTACAALAFLGGITNGHPHWFAALAPVLSVLGTCVLVVHGADRRWGALPEGWSYAEIAQVYRVAGAVMFAAWSFEYVPAQSRVAFFAALGAAQILAGSLRQARGGIVIGALYAAAALVIFWSRWTAPVAWLDLAAMLAVPAALRIGTRRAGDAARWTEASQILVGATLASTWLWVTRWTFAHGYVGQLTVAWALLALVVLAAGLALRERLYRLGGFAILALAVGRLFIVDVWRFDTLYRIVSFLVLGVVLLALSFVYHRFAELMRRWL